MRSKTKVLQEHVYICRRKETPGQLLSIDNEIASKA